jgi:hypothetical protein
VQVRDMHRLQQVEQPIHHMLFVKRKRLCLWSCWYPCSVLL